MAHKKGQGSTRNGRDSLPKMRGVKRFAGENVTAGSILVRQVGTKFHAGKNVKRANIYTAKEWFKVLQTTKRSQTAVMTLGGGQSTGEKPEAFARISRSLSSQPQERTRSS